MAGRLEPMDQRHANGRNRRESDSRDAPPDCQFATAETGRAVEGQDPAIHWMAVTGTAMTQTGNSRLFLQQNWALKHPLGGADQVLRGLAEERMALLGAGCREERGLQRGVGHLIGQW